jgi:hypothetical protein
MGGFLFGGSPHPFSSSRPLEADWKQLPDLPLEPVNGADRRERLRRAHNAWTR